MERVFFIRNPIYFQNLKTYPWMYMHFSEPADFDNDYTLRLQAEQYH